MRRFFFDKTDLSEKELIRFSSPDWVNHIAYRLAVEIEGDSVLKSVAVARCFRDAEDDQLTEIVIVTADAWKELGAGSELLCSLSSAVYGIGIRRWYAPMFSDNIGMARRLGRFATPLEEGELGNRIVETVDSIMAPKCSAGRCLFA